VKTPVRLTSAPKPGPVRQSGLSFTEKKRLEDLPAQIARLEAEIEKLSTLLQDADLFVREPVKFRKATEALTERQAALEAAETEWLELADRA
jgi:ABC transport system ATP-binding/permease protein